MKNDKENRILRYPLDRLYFIEINGYKKVAISYEMSNKTGYRSLDSSTISYKVDIIDTLQNVLKENNLEVLLIGPNGNIKQALTNDDIFNIEDAVRKATKLTQEQSLKLDQISFKLVDMTSDLLGFNVSVNPSTNLKLNERFDIIDVVVSAQKLNIFKNTLYNFVKSSFLTEQSVILLNNGEALDYRVSRALRVAKIDREKIKENTFNLLGRNDGSVEINGILEKEDVKVSGFQKRIKL